MSDYHLSQDVKKCIGCHACAVACKSHKDLPVGPKISQIIPVGPTMVGGLPRATYTFLHCFHCEKPWCVDACPTGAMQKRPSDGIVFVDPELCVGCKVCMSACPWGVPQWNPETRKAVKCDYCMDRVDQGLDPACVTVCTTRCLDFGTPNELRPVKRERYARAVADQEEKRG